MRTGHLPGQAWSPPLTRILSLVTDRNFFLEPARQTLNAPRFAGTDRPIWKVSPGSWIFNSRTPLVKRAPAHRRAG